MLVAEGVSSASPSLEVVVGLALAERVEPHAFAVQRGPRGRVVGLERWSAGPGNVASLGGLVVLEVVAVVGVGLGMLEHVQARASARASWWPSSITSAGCTRSRSVAELVVLAVVGLEHG